MKQNLQPLNCQVIRIFPSSLRALRRWRGREGGREEGCARSLGGAACIGPVEWHLSEVRAGEMDRLCRGGGDADVTMPKTASMIALHGDNSRDGEAGQLPSSRQTSSTASSSWGGARRPSPLVVSSQSLPDGSVQQLIIAWWDHTRLVFDGIDDQLLLLCRSAVLSFCEQLGQWTFRKK
jgi:hypothetical protein